MTEERDSLDRLDRIAEDEGLFPEAASGADQWQRVVMNEAISAYIESLDPAACRAAEISGDSHTARPWKEHTSLDYPDFDLCASVAGRGKFDVVICAPARNAFAY